MFGGPQVKQATPSVNNPPNLPMKIAAASDAYDTLLLNTSKFTLHFSGSNSAAVFTLDSDSAKNALAIKLQPLDRNQAPFFAYTVDILQNDVVVQSVVNPGTQNQMDEWKKAPTGQSINRGGNEPLSVDWEFKHPGICDVCACA